MKDKAIFIISIVLVIAGISYLGFTAYKFFTRDTINTANDQKQQTTLDKVASLELTGSSNQEILAENLPLGQQISISASLKNNSDTKVDTNFEGRTYSINELFTFPNIDTDIPVEGKPIKVSLDAGKTNSFTYSTTPTSCGTYYMALANNDYWNKGRGTITYGYFTVACDDSTASSQGSGGLNVSGKTGTSTSTATTAKEIADQRKNQGQVAGASTKGGQPVKQLPKSGPSETTMLLGILAIISAFVYRIKKIKA